MASRNYQTILFDGFNTITEQYLPASGASRPRNFNYYSGIGDRDIRRAAFVWMHGGGGSLDDGRQWADITKYGYAVFSIDFGESGSGFDPQNIIDGINNTRVFVRFLHSEHKTFGVNANLVFLTGTSFGGMIATSYNAAQNKFTDLKYPQFISPVNDFYKKAKQNIFASACFPGTCDQSYRDMIDANCSPIRAYHGVKDITLSIDSIRKTISQFQRMGVNAVLKEYPEADHKLAGLHDDIVANPISGLVPQFATLMGIPLVPPTAAT